MELGVNHKGHQEHKENQFLFVSFVPFVVD
jgi:hypothetical protein